MVYLTIAVTFICRRINRKLSNIISIITLFFFMFITGFSGSVVRACIMGMVVVVSKLIHRKSDMINTIALSLLIILFYNPYWIFEVGLLLSYGGVIGIVMLYKKILALFKTKNKITEALAVSISAQIIIIPIMAYYFNTISLTFFIPNLLVIPIIPIAMLLRTYKPNNTTNSNTHQNIIKSFIINCRNIIKNSIFKYCSNNTKYNSNYNLLSKHF